MSIRKNTAVVLTQLTEETIDIALADGQAFQVNIDSFRDKLNGVDVQHLLECLMGIKLNDAGINPLTATFTQLKTALDGNYKI
jgi:hypothetical protein